MRQEVESKFRALVHLGIHIDLTIELGHDALADGESEANTTLVDLLGRLNIAKELEQLLDILLVNSDTSVSN